MEAAVKQISIATPDQVTEVEKLCGIIRVSDEEKEKWFTKAGVESFAEMDTETVNKVITYLKGKTQ